MQLITVVKLVTTLLLLDQVTIPLFQNILQLKNAIIRNMCVCEM